MFQSIGTVSSTTDVSQTLPTKQSAMSKKMLFSPQKTSMASVSSPTTRFRSITEKKRRGAPI